MAEQTVSRYRVLRQVATPDEKYPTAWVVVAKEIPARSQQEALKAAVTVLGDTAAAVYIAIPERSWVPTNVAPKVVTTFAFGEVTEAAAAPAESTVAT